MAAKKEATVVELASELVRGLREAVVDSSAGDGCLGMAVGTFTEELERMFRDLGRMAEVCPDSKLKGEVSLSVAVHQGKDGNWVAVPLVSGSAISGKQEKPYVSKPSARSTLHDAQLSLFGPGDDESPAGGE